MNGDPEIPNDSSPEETGDDAAREILEDIQKLGGGSSAGSGDSSEHGETLSEVPPSPSASDPERIGPYRILGILGEGGMGVVYLAEQRAPIHRRVALKLIRKGMDSREVVARFESERQALALLNHPGIARVHEASSTEDGRPYFVMEYVQGVSLTEYCDRNCLNIEERLGIFIDVCGAVEHAHAHGIIHRDLKPSNILVAVEDGKPAPKIIDFGVAKATSQRLTEKTVYTELGQIIGTPEYMSPEQAEMTEMRVDPRTDVYSLGVILYELLVGALPFSPEELRRGGYAEIQRIIREEEPERPSTRLSSLGGESRVIARKRRAELGVLMRQIRGDLDWIAMKALEKSLPRRYGGAAVLAEDIARYLANEPVRARPPSAIYRLRKYSRRHRAILLPAAAAATAVLVLALVNWIERVQLDARRRVERIEDCRRSLDAGRESWRRFLEVRARKDELISRWEAAAGDVLPDAPVWERGNELDAWRVAASLREELEVDYDEAVLRSAQALQKATISPELEGEARSLFEEIYRERYREAVAAGGSVEVSGRFFQKMSEIHGTGATAREASGRVEVAIASRPAGAEVSCFRYAAFDGYLLPLPYDPRSEKDDPEAGILAGPCLVIESVDGPGREAGFQAGDRLIRVGDRDVRVLREFGEALNGLREGAIVEVEILRAGRKVSIPFVPFPIGDGAVAGGGADAGIRLRDLRRQLGIDFVGYPLEPSPEASPGRTAEGSAVTMSLLPGSYLILLRKEGYCEARYPVVLPDDRGRHEIALMPLDRVPEGFVYIPTGKVRFGGDAEAYNPLPRGEADVPGFYLCRNEVTIGEWLLFLNDPETLTRVDTRDGTAAPLARCEWVEADRIQLVPKYGSLLFRWDEAAKIWQSPVEDGKPLFPDDAPVFSVPMLAGLEYAAWRTRKAGGRWRFRLPGDLEWERAARGGDRRPYVWGSYPLYSFCRSRLGVRGKIRPDGPVGTHPMDESIFGVRDLAGSVSEAVPERSSPSLRLSVYRGSNWEATDPRDYRIATRNRCLPESPIRYNGLRLAADLDPPGTR